VLYSFYEIENITSNVGEIIMWSESGRIERIKGMWTPWGLSQTKENICRGINFYSTASHGGFKVSKNLNKLIPDYMRNDDGWYEEDCTWSFFVVALIHRCPQITDNLYQYAKKTMRCYYWEEYEKFFVVTLAKGESNSKDEFMFFEENKDNLLVISAINSHIEKMVCVEATIGGKRGPNVNKRYFLIPKNEYENRSDYAFVVNPFKHQETDVFM